MAELVEAERADDDEVVVAGEADGRALAHELAALVRPRAVADHVAEAPDLVHARRIEHGFERMVVPVDVRENRDAHRRY